MQARSKGVSLLQISPEVLALSAF